MGRSMGGKGCRRNESEVNDHLELEFSDGRVFYKNFTWHSFSEFRKMSFYGAAVFTPASGRKEKQTDWGETLTQLSEDMKLQKGE